HFTARFDHLDGDRLNGGGFSAQEQFLHRDPTAFFHQSDLSHPGVERVLPGLWGPHEHRPYRYDCEIQVSCDACDAVLNKHAAILSNTGAKTSGRRKFFWAAWIKGRRMVLFAVGLFL